MFKFLKDRFSKLKKALSKTTHALTTRIKTLFQGPWDEKTFEYLEQILYEADLGTVCAVELVDKTKAHLKKHPDAHLEDILAFLHAQSLEILEKEPAVKSKQPEERSPKVILIVGVNGSGKTTSIAKLAYVLKNEGKNVLLAAADTFRAAATEQLVTWANRLDIPVIKSEPGADPAAIAYDALQAAIARGHDTVIIDTAGRLQNKTDLMRQLEKILRVMQKVVPQAPHETLLVLDATTGQNAVDQAEIFHQFTPLTGLILTKLDGSAKGGIILSIYQKLGIPVEWVGVGENIDDLIPFDKVAYVDALFKK